MERKRVAGRFVRELADGAEVEATGEVGEQEVRRVLTGAPRPKFCRTYAKKRVAEALPAIAERFVEEAKKGSIQHAKVLIRLSGLDGKDVPKPAKRRGKSLAGRLLEELRKRPERSKEEE
jgi:hypothetical protein